MNELKQGTLLQGGKYVIKRVLGQGGFGITYLAEQVSLGREVAIKEFFMKDGCMRDGQTGGVTVPSTGAAARVEQFRKKFFKEARSLASLDHPHIISVIEVFEENGTVYYSMPYMSNGSLKSLVQKKGPLSESEALHFVSQVASALQYMHDRRMCHYDVKPDNILIDNRNNAMLIDFGISKNYDADGKETSNTPIGISEGYAPIEQYQGLSGFSPASDVYALGATLYYLLMGVTPPFAAHLSQGAKLTIDSTVSDKTKSLITSAMQIRADSRPQMNAFMVELPQEKGQHRSADDAFPALQSAGEGQRPSRESYPTRPLSSKETPEKQKVRVKCPKCGTVLDVTNSKGEGVKRFSCPVCNTKLKISFNKKDEPNPYHTSALPLGFILKSPKHQYRILSTVKETDFIITYRAELINPTSITRVDSYLISEHFDKYLHHRMPDGSVTTKDTVVLDRFYQEAKMQTGLDIKDRLTYFENGVSDSRGDVLNAERFFASGTDYFVVRDGFNPNRNSIHSTKTSYSNSFWELLNSERSLEGGLHGSENPAYLTIDCNEFCKKTAIRCLYIKNTCIKDIYKMAAEGRRYPKNSLMNGCMVIGRWQYDEANKDYYVSLEEVVMPDDDAVPSNYEFDFGQKIKLKVLEKLRKLRRETGQQYDVTCWVHTNPGLGVSLSNNDKEIHKKLGHPNHPILTAMVIDNLTTQQELGIFTIKPDGTINSKADLIRMYSLEEIYKWALESELCDMRPDII